MEYEVWSMDGDAQVECVCETTAPPRLAFLYHSASSVSRVHQCSGLSAVSGRRKQEERTFAHMPHTSQHSKLLLLSLLQLERERCSARLHSCTPMPGLH